MTDQPNRTITDFRARLRLGGMYATDAIREVVKVWEKYDGHLGKVATHLKVSRSTLERMRADYPDLAKALKAAQDLRAVFKG